MKCTIQTFDLNGICAISFKPRMSKKLAATVFDGLEHVVEKHVYALHAKDVETMKRRLNNEFAANLEYDETPFGYKRYFENKKNFVEREFDATKLPKQIREKAFEFQKEDIEKIVKMGARGFVGHESKL